MHDSLSLVLATPIAPSLGGSYPAAPGQRTRIPRRFSARSITKTGGSGQPSDIDLVIQELDKWPDGVLMALALQNTKVIVCRGSVTDFRTDLKGKAPRGWPPGSSWDTVPGLNFMEGNGNSTVIAIIGHAAGKPHVPVTGEGHGSVNLILHESGHAFDNVGNSIFRSKDATFTAARQADVATLSQYESQAPPAGPQECFAESAARFFGNDGTDAAGHPHLHAFWGAFFIGPEWRAPPSNTVPVPDSRPDPSPDSSRLALGHGCMNGDGSVDLFLRACDPDSGAQGCAVLSFGASDPNYDQIVAHLGGLTAGQSAAFYPWGSPPPVSSGGGTAVA
jgi:hypothetical protein